jgi:ADP-ribose pyrophosphatase
VWASLDEAKELVLSGAICGPTAVVGILAAWASRADGWKSLRSAREPWQMRDHLLSIGRVAEHFKKPGLS